MSMRSQSCMSLCGSSPIALSLPKRRSGRSMFRCAGPAGSRLLTTPKEDQIALVAESDGGLAGFGLAGPSGDASFGGRGEIKFLYVAAEFQRRGIGRRLIAAMARHLAERGYTGVGLSVVIGNEAAIAFYEGLGGRSIGNFTDPGPLWRSANFIYAWDDMPALIARAASATP